MNDYAFFYLFVIIFWPLFLIITRKNHTLPLIYIYLPITLIITHAGNYFYPWIGTIAAILFQITPIISGLISLLKLKKNNDGSKG